MGYRFVNPHADTAFSLDKTDKDQGRIKDEKHLAFIRTLPSILSGQMGCEAAHIRYGDPRHRKRKTPLARKPDDCFVIPLTPEEHRSQHSENERQWWAQKGIDPIQVALDLYDVSGNTQAALKVIRKLSGEVVRR